MFLLWRMPGGYLYPHSPALCRGVEETAIRAATPIAGRSSYRSDSVSPVLVKARFTTGSSRWQPRRGGPAVTLTVVVVASLAALLYCDYSRTNYFVGKPKSRPGNLEPLAYNPFTLIHREELSPTTSLFRFRVEYPYRSKDMEDLAERIQAAGLWSVDLKDHFVQTCRSYTPIAWSVPASSSRDGEPKAYMDLMVKLYPHGSVSRFVHATRIGDAVEIRGPILTWQYTPNKHKHIVMISGGTGVAPMYQLITRILGTEDGCDQTQMTLVYANRSEQDIPLYNELTELQRKYPDRLNVHFVVDKASPDTGLVKAQHEGLLSRELIASVLPSLPPHSTVGSGSDISPLSANPIMVLVSGPPGMMQLVCGNKFIDSSQGEVTGILGQLGLTNRNVFKL
ncbi:hypothetical protein EV182_005372 [Spiromyces aspiralis]|uniref:Uncharacterized protein n=1 Tax=Spiromyces aspiralis TaxID=68401 RepID=A0ACC1HAQ5_9FUNG|nr:hypothetical protein EV182_005372 [Spiromyces aspiralis]